MLGSLERKKRAALSISLQKHSPCYGMLHSHPHSPDSLTVLCDASSFYAPFHIITLCVFVDPFGVSDPHAGTGARAESKKPGSVLRGLIVQGRGDSQDAIPK